MAPSSSSSSSSPSPSTIAPFSSVPPKLKVQAKSTRATLSAPKPQRPALQVRPPFVICVTRSQAWDGFWVSSRRGLMATTTLPCLLQLREFIEGSFPANAAELNSNKYTIIKEEIRKVVSKGKAAGVLRLVFHDAGTFEMEGSSGGANGSIVYELDRPENAGLKKSLKVLEKAKTEVDAKQRVSWADMISVAGAEAVSICGGPTIYVTLGRLDSPDPDPPGRLPQESLDASGLKQSFQKKGLSTQELVALSGAHTLGSKGFGNPNVFDNSSYKILLWKPWSLAAGMSSMVGLPSECALAEDDECLRWIKAYANDQNLFFKDFKDAYTNESIEKWSKCRWITMELI